MELSFRILNGGRCREEGLTDFSRRRKKLGYRLFMPISAGVELIVDDESRELDANNFYFVRESSLQLQRCRPGADMYWLSCAADTLEMQHSLSLLPSYSELPATVNLYGQRLYEYMDRIFKRKYRPQRRSDDLAAAALCRLNVLLFLAAAQLMEQAEVVTSAHEDDLDGNIYIAISYIDSNITRKLKIEDIAARAKMSKSSLHSKFREIYNTTPINYITDRRLSLARQLLSTTDIPVREVAKRVGYENEFYFSRVFKEYLQYSPSDFRRVHSAIHPGQGPAIVR